MTEEILSIEPENNNTNVFMEKNSDLNANAAVMNPSKNCSTDNQQDKNDITKNIVNTDDCIDVLNNMNQENKYVLNPKYHPDLKHPHNDEDEDNEFSEVRFLNHSGNDASWIPSILKGEKWPTQSIPTPFGEAESNDNNKENHWEEDNPLLSLSAKDTVLWQNNTKARDDANWRKYQNDENQKNKDAKVKNFINNEKLKKLPNNESITVPDTFAKKMKFVDLEKFKNSSASPLKLFENSNFNDVSNFNTANNGNTKKVDVVNKMLNHLSPKRRLSNLKKMQDFQVKDGSAHYKDEDDSINKDKRNNIDDQDLTSDAEEFSTFPDPLKFVADGNKIIQNMRKQSILMLNQDHDKNNFSPTKESADNITNVSDYTSASEYVYREESNINDNNDKFDSINILRSKLTSKAESFKSEFNVKEPEIQSQFNIVSKDDQKTMPTKPKGLKFIPASEYKDKVYDKKLDRYVLKSEFYKNHGNKDTSNLTEADASDPFNFSKLDPDQTSNSILKSKPLSSYDSYTVSELENEPNAADEFTDEEYEGDSVEREQDGITVTDTSLVEAINETYPASDWKQIEELEISGFGLPNLVHLEKMTPNLWYLNASNNEINQNFGIPSGIQVLDLGFNKFNKISSKFSHNFSNLQILNLSHNENVTDLRLIKDLINLTSLDLSFNKIEDLQYLENFKMLRYLNLNNNQISGTIDFKRYKLWFLEDLLLDNNKIAKIMNLKELSHLNNLSINNNLIKSIQNDEYNNDYKQECLKRISMNNNLIKDYIDFEEYSSIKVLQLDNLNLRNVHNLPPHLTKASVRFHSKEEIVMSFLKHSATGNISLKTLYLTGSRLPSALPFHGKKFSMIETLDLSSMNLGMLPSNFGNFFPLLIDLNLNFNNLENLKGLEDLKTLKQLKLLNNNLSDLKNDVFTYTSNLRSSLKFLDLRINPITKGFYPSVFYKNDLQDDINPFEFGSDAELGMKLEDRLDIEAFSVEYSRLYEKEGLIEWDQRLQKNKKSDLELENYLVTTKKFFFKLKFLDGHKV